MTLMRLEELMYDTFVFCCDLLLESSILWTNSTRQDQDKHMRNRRRQLRQTLHHENCEVSKEVLELLNAK